LLLTIALLILEPFLYAYWKKSSEDFFFGIGDSIRSKLYRIKSKNRIKGEGRKRDIIREYVSIVKRGLARSK